MILNVDERDCSLIYPGRKSSVLDGRNYFLSITACLAIECFRLPKKMKAYRFLLENLSTTRLMETHVL